jgi:2-amino-4-hydroxy-6-hydroxymethyldihydropteridine diphosphokinase
MRDTVNGTTAYLSLGSNLGDRRANLAQAVGFLQAAPEIVVSGVSSLYETAPVGLVDQSDFMNLALALQSSCGARQLLELCLGIETQMGRERIQRWGPRNIDIDILLFGDQRIGEPDLIVPHPRLLERQFVLVPLAEIAPGLLLPDGRTAAEAADPMTTGVRCVGRL